MTVFWEKFVKVWTNFENFIENFECFKKNLKFLKNLNKILGKFNDYRSYCWLRDGLFYIFRKIFRVLGERSPCSTPLRRYRYTELVYDRAVAKVGQGAMPPPRIPSPANFRNLANLEEELEKMQWCFHILPFLTSKAFSSVHLSHVIISIFIVFLLRTDRILCVCVCTVY